MNFLRVEIRRALHRRSVWWLLLVATAGIGVIGFIAFATAPQDRFDPDHPASLASWWTRGGADGALLLGVLFLLMGAIIGGATATGGEWRAGTLPLLLTWQPARVRFALTRLAACAICAGVIGVLLQAAYLIALAPAVLVRGTTAGVDGGWWLALFGAVLRGGLMTSLAAVLAASLGLVLRNTAAVLGVLWVWLSVVENIVRGLKPWSSRFLVSDNVGRVVTWFDHGAREAGSATRSPGVALLLLGAYLAATVVIVVRTFARSDAVSA